MTPPTTGSPLVELIVDRLDLKRPVTALSPGDMTRAASISHDLERRRYLASHQTLRVVLGRHMGCRPADLQIVRRAGGKPRCDGGGPYFSLSRSEDWCAVAVSHDADVGVDLEVVRAFDGAAEVAVATLPESLATPVLEALPGTRSRTFYRSWCAGEASAKAAGFGMAECRRALAGTSQVVADLPPELVVAVAVRGPHPPRVMLRDAIGISEPAWEPAPQVFPANGSRTAGARLS